MGFFRNRYNTKFNITKFKQNKTHTEKRSWDLFPTANQRLLAWSEKVPDRYKARLQSKPKRGKINTRLYTARKLAVRKKFKITVRYGKILLKGAKKTRKLLLRHVRFKKVRGLSVAYFFRTSFKIRRNSSRIQYKTHQSLRALNQFRLPRLFAKRLLKRTLQMTRVSNWNGAVLLSVLKAARLEKKFWRRYTLTNPQRAKIKKQQAYSNRHFGPLNIYRLVVLKTNSAWWIKKAVTQGTFRPFVKIKTGALSDINVKRKAMLWRRSAGSRTRSWRFLRLNFKFYKRTAQGAKFGTVSNFRKNLRQREWQAFKISQLRYELKKPYANFSIKQLEALQRKWRNQVNTLGHHPTRKVNKELFTRLAHITKKINVLKAPAPWWKKNKKGKPHAKFIKKHQRFFQNKRYLMGVRWFKLISRRYKAFNSIGVAWGGIESGNLTQKYSWLKYDKNKKKRKKVGVHYVSPTGLFGWKKVYAASKLVVLKNRLAKHLVFEQDGFHSGTKMFVKRPLLLSVRKVARSFDFNKFFKVNKAVARNMNEISADLYSQYVSNLQEGFQIHNNVLTYNTSNTIYAKRALRKYVKLLQQYFKVVQDNKMAKNIPASSAMHWIREYLRLTNETWRRNSLWNRFNRVAFNFKPKAKEDEKRGRKKKILFKAKILFDRLFQWLYAQPNARYALAAPIQKGVIRDYIVRNQFIFKKGFKIKMPVQ